MFDPFLGIWIPDEVVVSPGLWETVTTWAATNWGWMVGGVWGVSAVKNMIKFRLDKHFLSFPAAVSCCLALPAKIVTTAITLPFEILDKICEIGYRVYHGKRGLPAAEEHMRLEDK